MSAIPSASRHTAGSSFLGPTLWNKSLCHGETCRVQRVLVPYNEPLYHGETCSGPLACLIPSMYLGPTRSLCVEDATVSKS